ncbi:MAG: 50S ribosomal protein L15 [Candidatus Zixiibacteriota bacterium]
MLELSNLKPPEGSRKSRKRVGRGPGSGLGKTAGRGENGQKSRSGGNVQPWMVGGSFQLALRLPKRGFRNIFRKVYQTVNVGELSRLSSDEVTPQALKLGGLIKSLRKPVKLLGDGKVETAFRVSGVKFTGSARAKIEAAGGSFSNEPKGA